jgi:cell filamentation protein
MRQMKGLRYHEATGAEGATEPGSRGRVLANLQGIKSKRAMDLAEYEALLVAQELYTTTLTTETRFTAELLCSIHRDWLGSLYVWAGSYRTVELRKGSFAWPPAHRVAENMTAFERDPLTRLTPCRSGPLERAAEDVAAVHADLLLIHPFRDGNGRLARWLADLMFTRADFPVPDYGFVGRGSTTTR